MKVLIVDDDALVRDGLKIILGLESDIDVVDTAANGQEAFDICKDKKPDIVLMDIRMPVMDGVLGTKLIKEHFRDIKVVILTTFKDDEYIKEALKSGAEGYLLKNQPTEIIVETIRTVMKGNFVLEKDVASKVSHMLQYEEKKPSAIMPDLSEREFEILQQISSGLSNKEIAEKLFLSEGTIRNYITVLLEKLDLRDRTQLAIFYIRNCE